MAETVELVDKTGHAVLTIDDGRKLGYTKYPDGPAPLLCDGGELGAFPDDVLCYDPYESDWVAQPERPKADTAASLTVRVEVLESIVDSLVKGVTK
jgi:hypothetical protein